MSNEHEYPIFKTPNGKTIEVRPDGIYGLWVINPHGTNLPTRLKDAKYTTEALASAEVLNWIEEIKVKQNGKTNSSKDV